MLNLVLLGAPGAGKGTQAERLVQKYRIVHVSTGNIFREEISKQSGLGLEVKNYLDSGKLVPDELTVAVLTQRISQPDCGKGFLLDGFPRTVAQAKALGKYLSSAQQKLNAVIYLELSQEQAVARLSKRGRADDNPETITNRFMVFKEQTEPLIAYYKEENLLQTVNGDKDVDSVFESVCQTVDSVKV